MIRPGLSGGEASGKTFQQEAWILVLRGADEELVLAALGTLFTNQLAKLASGLT